MPNFFGVIFLILGAMLALVPYLSMKHMEYKVWTMKHEAGHRVFKQQGNLEIRTVCVTFILAILAICFPITHSSMLSDYITIVIKCCGLLIIVGTVLYSLFHLFLLVRVEHRLKAERKLEGNE